MGKGRGTWARRPPEAAQSTCLTQTTSAAGGDARGPKNAGPLRPLAAARRLHCTRTRSPSTHQSRLLLLLLLPLLVLLAAAASAEPPRRPQAQPQAAIRHLLVLILVLRRRAAAIPVATRCRRRRVPENRGQVYRLRDVLDDNVLVIAGLVLTV